MSEHLSQGGMKHSMLTPSHMHRSRYLRHPEPDVEEQDVSELSLEGCEYVGVFVLEKVDFVILFKSA